MLEKWLAIINNTVGANAHIIYVNGADGDDGDSGLTLALAKDTIAGAMAIATAGDMIVVMPGTYAETVAASMAITIIGWDRATTIISPATGNGVTITTNNVTIKNITINSSANDSSYGVYGLVRSRITLENVKFTTATADATNYPLGLIGGTEHYLKNCEVAAKTYGIQIGSGIIDNLTLDCDADLNNVVAAVTATGRVIINGGSIALTQVTKDDGNTGSSARYVIYADGAGAQITLNDVYINLSLGSADAGDGYSVGTDGDGEIVYLNRCVMVIATAGAGAVKNLNAETGSNIILRDCVWAGTYDGAGTISQYAAVNTVLSNGGALISTSDIENACGTALNTEIPGSPTAGSVNALVKSGGGGGTRY